MQPSRRVDPALSGVERNEEIPRIVKRRAISNFILHFSSINRILLHLQPVPSKASAMVRGRRPNADLPVTKALQQQREFRAKKAERMVRSHWIVFAFADCSRN